MSTSSLARTATWLAAGRGLVALVAMALPIVLARLLSQHDYGLYKQVDLAAALLMPFIVLGFDKSITFYVPRRESEVTEEITTPMAALLGIAVAVCAFALLAPKLFGDLFGTASIPLLTTASATYGVASALQLVGARTLVAIDAAKLAALLPVIVGIPRTLVVLGVVLVHPTLDAILWVVLAFAVVTVLAWLVALAARRCLTLALSRLVLVRHFRYGGVLAFGSLAQTWGNQLDNYLVASTLPPATFAVYRVGRLRVPFLPIFSRALLDATAPRYSRLESEQRYKEMAALWKRSFEILLPMGILFSVCLSSTAQWSIPLIYPDYPESVPIFRVFAFAILLESLIGIEQLLRALAALRFLVISTLAALAVRVVVGLAVLDHGPLWLLTLAQLSVSVALFWARSAYVRSRLGVSWGALVPPGAALRPLPLAAVGLLATWGIARVDDAPDWLRLAVALGVWGLLVVFVVWREGLLRKVLPDRLFRTGG